MAQIFRVERTKNFTVMSNHHFKNKNLTLKAKGLLSLMLSLPDDWNYNMQGLATLSRGLLCADTGGGDRKGTGWKCMNRATVHIVAGLPLTWVATQKEDFQKYLLQNECVDFTFRNKSIMWSLQVLIFTHRDLQQPFTAYRISKESTCLWILETEL